MLFKTFYLIKLGCEEWPAGCNNELRALSEYPNFVFLVKTKFGLIFLKNCSADFA